MALTTASLLARLETYAAWDKVQLKNALLATLSEVDGFEADKAVALEAVCEGFSSYYNSRLEGLAQAIVETLETDAVVTVSGIQTGSSTVNTGRIT